MNKTDLTLLLVALLCMSVFLWRQYPHRKIQVIRNGEVVLSIRVFGDGYHEDDWKGMSRAFTFAHKGDYIILPSGTYFTFK
jgi:hypothetical protein